MLSTSSPPLPGFQSSRSPAPAQLVPTSKTSRVYWEITGTRVPGGREGPGGFTMEHHWPLGFPLLTPRVLAHVLQPS